VSGHHELIEQAQSILGHRFADPGLLVLSLTHASVAGTRLESNERLEFLGDAVLGLVACERIYGLYPDLLEGEMTKIKSVAVSRRICAKIAQGIGLETLMRLGKGIRDEAGEMPHSLAAAALESAIGAVYLDGGLEAVRRWIGPLLEPYIRAAAESGHQQNFKSVLQQHVQRTHQTTPEYTIVSQSGPDHAKTFTVAVQIGAQQFEAARGPSKKQAEQRAALNALSALDLVRRDDEGSIMVIEPAAT
jgi:ribonuclease-3